jgi:hypothetical protein
MEKLPESPEAIRREQWKQLYASLAITLAKYGRHDAFGDGDFFLVDDDYGSYQHKVEYTSDTLLTSGAREAARDLLLDYSELWEVIFVARRSGESRFSIVTRLQVGDWLPALDE